ncbi:hypothetical protein HBH61_110370 [Parastagonospora nodorum]|nr:hypothetical protein HBH61_110370 [Parastagonospora nodorum]KAH5076702.1 hypothetical protein HBH95_117220 [Parastagonospora nodorum]KAH5202468.1 hypothetical protein HBH68_113970 [Parastagonospora nodorum]KAH5472754.1 hypothetical protein HBI28_129060 [Parastagonospora nodorum]KAH5506751.1 hypothetical protein HBI29_126910 [Parastagonospora nodorum]
MSSSHPARGNDVPQEEQDRAPPPTYTEQLTINHPTDEAGSSSQSNAQQTQNSASAQSTTKPEASSYASAYRPSDAQNAERSPSQFDYGAQHQLGEEEPAPNPDQPPPAYTELPGQLQDNNGLGTNAIVADDGRVDIRIDQKSRALSQLILPQIQRQLSQVQEDPAPPPPYVPEFLGGAPGQRPPPPLNVVIQVVGSRGDVQPFVALGKVLKDTYGHRVRLATHPTFKDFVIENGLEFFSIGGDPAELMAFMVKNPGLMPGFDTMRSGDIGKRRKGIAEILRGTWRSCIETGNGLGVDPLKQTVEEWMGIEDQLPEQLKRPFVADAIIANPPAFGHIHCAEKLGIPLHMMFTMPWSPTQQFPHPLANIQSSNADANITNYISYIMVDILTWQGLGDVINRFRKDSLHLDPISIVWAPAMLARLKVPFTYCWSPALIPKPKDWNHHISVAGFYFLDLAQNYQPAADLAAFLDAGEPPVYIGFGSIVVDDPNAMTKMIFEAVKMTGRRALVSKGWGGLGADELGIPEGVFMLGNCPHDWLFKRVSAVVHHGGAGTTAAGIAAGRPTVVVPFFGDQPFWGAMVARAGAGPDPVPYKDLTAEKLAESINKALEPQSLERAQELCNKIKQEDGCQKGAQAFHQMLRYDELRCAVLPNRPAVWRVKRTEVKLSAQVATVLAQQGELNFSELKLHRPREFCIDDGPVDPISGGAGAIMGTATSIMMGVADMPIQTLKLLNIHPDARASKKGKERAIGDNASSTAESSGAGRPPTTRTKTNDTDVSIDSTAPIRSNTDKTAVQSPGSRSSSRERARALRRESSNTATGIRTNSGTATPPPDKPGPDLQESMTSAVDTGKGLARIIGAGFKSPMDFSLNVAKGLHNVPKLYGAEVRQVDKVTDFQSGVRTAAKEFGFGLYDGITGIVTDPYKGAKKEGAVGFVKGVGQGIFSVPFRVMGGAWAVPGYAMKGIYQEMIKGKGKAVQNYIIAARIAQGYDEANGLSTRERDAIVSQWKYVKVGIKKKKNVGEDQMDSLHSLVQDKRKRRQERWARVDSHFKRPEAQPSFPPAINEHSGSQEPSLTHSVSHGSAATEPGPRTIPPGQQPAWRQRHAATFPRTNSNETQESQVSLEAQLIAEEEAERRELEAAIAASISQNSHGNPDEDKLVANAIRASIAELDRTPETASVEEEEQALKRAMQASLDEAGRNGSTAEEQRLLEETIRQSLLDTSRRRQHGDDSEWDSDGDTEDEEEFQRIVAESKELAHLHAAHPEEYQSASGAQESGIMNDIADATGANGTHPADEDEELKKALEMSEKAHQESMQKLEAQKTEEDIVMEYVRKQSLLEEEHRQKVLQGRNTAGEGSGGK